MSYKIVMSKQQLQIIKVALEVCPALDDTDEFGDNVLDVLTKLAEATLEEAEDDSLHGWIV